MDRPIDIAARLFKKVPKLDEFDLEHINAELDRLQSLPDDEVEAELEGKLVDATHHGNSETVGRVFSHLLEEIRRDRESGH